MSFLGRWKADAEAPIPLVWPPSGANSMDHGMTQTSLAQRVPQGPHMACAQPTQAFAPTLSMHQWREENAAFHTVPASSSLDWTF